MKVFRAFQDRPVFPDGTAVAIGNFDGLHLGHQEILRILVDQSRKRNLVPLVLTFSPHPEKVLGGGRTTMIQTLEQRLAGIRAGGVKAVLLAGLNAKAVVIGENFRFGRDRRGDVDVLVRSGRKMGFSVHPCPAVFRDGQIVSSSRIRALLHAGHIAAANRILGRPYCLEGTVVKGRGRGRDLGFPTANIRTINEIVPPGVYHTLAQIRSRFYPSLTNCGTRPTFGAGPPQIETYVFDFQDSLYRRKIGLHFLRKLRKEKRFQGADDLVRQIRQDVGASRLYFEKHASALPMIRVPVRTRANPDD
jgi:riboflavin kinase/FMN adenylyltransferase